MDIGAWIAELQEMEQTDEVKQAIKDAQRMLDGAKLMEWDESKQPRDKLKDGDDV